MDRRLLWLTDDSPFGEGPLETDELPTVVESLRGIDNVRIFLRLIREAGLTERLSDAGPYTLLAPLDIAFEELDDAAIDRLLADKEYLHDVLLYHVIPGRRVGSDLNDEAGVDTLLGQEVAISMPTEDWLMINEARVVHADIEASNGLIHVINALLVPVPVA